MPAFRHPGDGSQSEPHFFQDFRKAGRNAGLCFSFIFFAAPLCRAQ